MRVIDKFNSERGVSPVIGVVLMVAVTVILASVLNQFVLSIPGVLSSPVQAGVTIDEQPMSGPDNEYRVSVLLTNSQSVDGIIIQVDTENNIKDRCYDTRLTEVGQQEKIPKDNEEVSCPTGLSPGDEIVLIGINSQGDRAVIQTHTVGE